MVRQSAEAFLSMLDGPNADEGRAALASLTGLPPETDWKTWFVERCALPEGT
jgi:hypothetical protein